MVPTLHFQGLQSISQGQENYQRPRQSSALAATAVVLAAQTDLRHMVLWPSSAAYYVVSQVQQGSAYKPNIIPELTIPCNAAASIVVTCVHACSLSPFSLDFWSWGACWQREDGDPVGRRVVGQPPRLISCSYFESLRCAHSGSPHLIAICAISISLPLLIMSMW